MDAGAALSLLPELKIVVKRRNQNGYHSIVAAWNSASASHSANSARFAVEKAILVRGADNST